VAGRYEAMLRRLPRRIVASGQVLLPACPSLTDHYTRMFQRTFAELGRVFTSAELASLRDILERKLKEGFALSPHARIAIDYRTDEPPESSLSYRVTLQVATAADEYARWVRTRPPPLFGKHPDAKVMWAARSLGAPSEVRVLDIGAGTGRNLLPLARAGFQVDAIEPAPALAEILAAELARAGLAARVFHGDPLAAGIGLPAGPYHLVLLSGVVSSHVRDAARCRTLLADAARALARGGLLVFDAFLARDGYAPDAIARELSQVFWCTLFTREELAGVLRGLPFEPVSDEPAAALERSAVPPAEWPPTPWFEDWSQGRDLFDLPPGAAPMELRWLVYRRV
jgi:SAM-dependent methyltransferase